MPRGGPSFRQEVGHLGPQALPPRPVTGASPCPPADDSQRESTAQTTPRNLYRTVLFHTDVVEQPQPHRRALVFSSSLSPCNHERKAPTPQQLAPAVLLYTPRPPPSIPRYPCKSLSGSPTPRFPRSANPPPPSSSPRSPPALPSSPSPLLTTLTTFRPHRAAATPRTTTPADTRPSLRADLAAAPSSSSLIPHLLNTSSSSA